MNREQKTGFLKFFLSELKPKGKIISPFNIISAVFIIGAMIILFFRFRDGLGSVTHASQDYPWGFWINFNVITGVALAGGAFVLTFMVYILGLEKYRPIVKATVLYALLAYIFYMGALLLDLGRPWKVINPVIGNSFGTSSVLFLVAWHFLIYTVLLFFEFYPTVTEWLTLKKHRKFFVSISIGVVILGILISSLHQSGLGALFLIAKSKIHPLWYNEFLPILFFVSCIFGGLSLVIILETISQRAFRKTMSFNHKSSHRNIIISLARVCSLTLFVYLAMLALVFLNSKNYSYLSTGWGYWYLLEVIGFVMIPCILFMFGYSFRNLFLIRTAAVVSILGIILNRLNVSTFTFKWYDNIIQYPTWKEVVVGVAVILAQILVFRWIVRRMPVYREPPAWSSGDKQNDTFITDDKKEKKWKITVE